MHVDIIFLSARFFRLHESETLFQCPDVILYYNAMCSDDDDYDDDDDGTSRSRVSARLEQ